MNLSTLILVARGGVHHHSCLAIWMKRRTSTPRHPRTSMQGQRKGAKHGPFERVLPPHPWFVHPPTPRTVLLSGSRVGVEKGVYKFTPEKRFSIFPFLLCLVSLFLHILDGCFDHVRRAGVLGEKRHINIFLLWLTSRWPWDKRLVVPGLTGPKSLCVRLETQEI